MRELLERWAKVEPERCRPNVHLPFTTNSDGDRVQLLEVRVGNAWNGYNLVRGKVHGNHAELLAAVIEAIESRGWRWELHGSVCLNFARVTALETYGCVADEPSDPLAFALLGAYLAAIKAVK